MDNQDNNLGNELFSKCKNQYMDLDLSVKFITYCTGHTCKPNNCNISTSYIFGWVGWSPKLTFSMVVYANGQAGGGFLICVVHSSYTFQPRSPKLDMKIVHRLKLCKTLNFSFLSYRITIKIIAVPPSHWEWFTLNSLQIILSSNTSLSNL